MTMAEDNRECNYCTFRCRKCLSMAIKTVAYRVASEIKVPIYTGYGDYATFGLISVTRLDQTETSSDFSP